MSDSNRNWMDDELTRQLAPVKAPSSLWGRIEAARRSGRAPRRAGWILWPALATLMLFATGDLAWEIGKARGSIAPLTAEDLAGLADGSACDFRSSDPAEVERWVKDHTNVDVELSCGRAGHADVLRAKIIRKRGATIAAVAYRFGQDAATLLISDRRSILRWDRDYSIVWSGSPRNPDACNHCHVDARSQL